MGYTVSRRNDGPNGPFGLSYLNAVAFTLAIALAAGSNKPQAAAIDYPSDPFLTVANTAGPNVTKAVAKLSENNVFIEVAEAVKPAVVNISTTRTVSDHGMEMPFFEDPLLRRFFGEDFFRRYEAPGERTERSLGSGVIVDSAGYIITNAHVIEEAEEISVVLNNGKRYVAVVVGTDPRSDIAVIRINEQNLPTIRWGNSDRLQAAESVLAIGNPFGLNQTVTLGIVSATGRANVGIAEYEDFIQTDAAINPGNSGGALVNDRGELVGINTAILSQSGGYMGIGFAVPANMVRSVMTSLIETGKVVRGWLGVYIQELTPELAEKFSANTTEGVLVSGVIVNSPAAEAGLKAGDVIISFAGQKTETTGKLRNVVAEAPLNTPASLQIIREGKEQSIQLTLVEQPSSPDEVQSPEEEKAKPQTPLEGLSVQDLTPEIAQQLGLSGNATGVVIATVAPGSAASRAGLQRGDVIHSIEGQAVNSIAEYEKLEAELGKNGKVLLNVIRQGHNLFVLVAP